MQFPENCETMAQKEAHASKHFREEFLCEIVSDFVWALHGIIFEFERKHPSFDICSLWIIPSSRFLKLKHRFEHGTLTLTGFRLLATREFRKQVRAYVSRRECDQIINERVIPAWNFSREYRPPTE
jgi:hypothetical protein